MAAAEHERLRLGKANFLDAEEDVSNMVKLTLSQSLNDEGVISFRLPGDPERHTDLNSVFLRLELRAEKRNGGDLVTTAPPAAGGPAEDHVCPEGGGMHSLFKSCDVFLNEHHVSGMIFYPYTAALTRYLGCTADMRTTWAAFDQSYDWQMAKSDMTTGVAPGWMNTRRNAAAQTHVATGRIFSDILMSSRQLLPPGVSLRIDLRRAPDHFSLISNATAGPNNAYRVKINYAMLYVKRIKLRPSLRHSVSSQNAFLTFNRLNTYSIAVAQGSRIFRWLNCLNGAPMPNRLYVAFAAQESVQGTLTRGSTYFENLNLSSLNFKLNGRDLLVEPLLTSVTKTAGGSTNVAASDLSRGYLSLLEVLNQIADQTTPLRLSYSSYVQGNTFFAVELGKCGSKVGSTGSLDLEVLTDETCNLLTERLCCS